MLINNKKESITVFTTSWDDGHKLDLKLVSLLGKYGIKGTFYISPENREFKKSDLLTNDEIRTISKDFEIGAHTMTHPRLTHVSPEEAKIEITQSKSCLEKIIGKPVTTFCYPGGDYNKVTETIVNNSGFKLARTTNRYSFSLGKNPFAMPTTFHTYNHYSDINKILRFSNWNIAKAYSYRDWSKLAIDLFNYAENTKGVFHLWGHSWELDKFNSWDKLEIVLKDISQRKNVYFCTNGELPI